MKPWRKFRPPTGPISPAQNAPAIGTGPSSSVDDAGVVVGRAEEVLPAAVAREQQRAAGVVAGRAARGGPRRRRPRRARGTARSGRRSTSSPTASAPVVRSAPSTLRTRKSPRPKSSCARRRRCRRAVPARISSRSSSLASVARSPGAAHSAGRPASSWTRFRSARGDDERAADGSASLRDDRAHLDTVEQHADRPVRLDAIVEHEPVPARSAGRGRHAADHLRARGSPRRGGGGTRRSGTLNGSARSSERRRVIGRAPASPRSPRRRAWSRASSDDRREPGVGQPRREATRPRVRPRPRRSRR